MDVESRADVVVAWWNVRNNVFALPEESFACENGAYLRSVGIRVFCEFLLILTTNLFTMKWGSSNW